MFFSLITIVRIDFSSRKKKHRKDTFHDFPYEKCSNVCSSVIFHSMLIRINHFFSIQSSQFFFKGGTTKGGFANHRKVHFFLIINHNDVDKAH